MEYKGKEYNIILTYQCENCKAIEFINPDDFKDQLPMPIIIQSSFMEFILGDLSVAPITVNTLSHICSQDQESTIIGPMKFSHAEIREIKNLNNGGNDAEQPSPKNTE